MKVGDIVTVTDGSWCLFYSGDGDLYALSGNALRGRKWRVLAKCQGAPTDNPEGCPLDAPNDVVLSEIACPEHLLFSQARFCSPTGDRREPIEPLHIAVPVGTRSLVLTFD